MRYVLQGRGVVRAGRCRMVIMIQRIDIEWGEDVASEIDIANLQWTPRWKRVRVRSARGQHSYVGGYSCCDGAQLL